MTVLGSCVFGDLDWTLRSNFDDGPVQVGRSWSLRIAARMLSLLLSLDPSP